MKTDRELLDLAAKAAGYEAGNFEADGIYIWPPGEADRIRLWRPLADDGDALRLAVTLGLAISIDTVEGITHAHHEQAWMAAAESHDYDPMAATRRAIVRAAAVFAEQQP